ncbi:MAG: hypothetical protein ACRD0D_05530 [Acidimicrobiales bacterium]
MEHLLDALFGLMGALRGARRRRRIDLQGQAGRGFGSVSWSTWAAAATLVVMALVAVGMSGWLVVLALAMLGDDLLAFLALFVFIPAALMAVTLSVGAAIWAVAAARGLLVAGSHARVAAAVFAAAGLLLGAGLASLGTGGYGALLMVPALALAVLLVLPSTSADFRT